ncbi:hypothetical protein ACFY8B_22375 [Streptomyces sp. NPDC012751]|uniref:hypothetical protein n=1 Tax=Streptomyces sp. NPDC012751 TaxID=3364846 RepID=UPI0036B95F8D
MRTGLLRIIGAVTFVYGVAAAYRPALLARPTGLVDPHGAVGVRTVTVLRPLAWRDAATGLAMVLAPEGPALATAGAVRIASDVGDAFFFGAALPGWFRRAGAVVSAGAWAGLTAASLAGGPGRANGGQPWNTKCARSTRRVPHRGRTVPGWKPGTW